MARIVRASESEQTPKKPEAAAKAEAAKKPAQTAAKKAEAAAKPAAQAAKKTGQAVVRPNKPTGGSTTGLRIASVAMWVVAIVIEVFLIMILLDYFYVKNKVLFLILGIVLDMGLCIGAAQLWKKANHIKPMSEKRGKFLFYLWNELGVIMACICFIPLIVLLLKNDKLDKKSKTIAAIVAIVALLITGAASADYHPITAEQKEEAEQQITTDVYWTQFGHKYHLNADEENGCPYIRTSGTVYKGSVTEAIESGRTTICSYCAAHYAEEMGLQLQSLNVEDGDETEQERPVDTTSAAVDTTGE